MIFTALTVWVSLLIAFITNPKLPFPIIYFHDLRTSKSYIVFLVLNVIEVVDSLATCDDEIRLVDLHSKNL